MAGEVAPWNLLQIALISVFPVWQSFTRVPTGMSLLAVYLFLMVLCIPPVFIQLKIGNHQQKGIVGLFAKHLPIAKGLGITLLIQLFLMCVYLVPLVTFYGLYGVIAIIQQPYVWQTCDNDWNTDACFHSSGVNPSVNGQPVQKVQSETPEAQFFDHGFLQIASDISNLQGFPMWTFSETFKAIGVPFMPIAMTITWFLIFVCVAFGGRICGWILFILGPTFLSFVFVTMGYGFSNLDRNGTDTFLHQLYTLDLDQFSQIQPHMPLIKDWIRGFILVMYSIPVWTAILPTMGKMTGRGRISRNVSWLILLLVFAATCQLPQLAMAPYIGNLLHLNSDVQYKTMDIDVVFKTMAAAFAKLEIPAHFALLFYLAIFIAGLMFLIVAMFTILDNLVDGLTDWVEAFQERRTCVNLCTAFVLMSIGVGASLLHTTHAGMYYIVLMDQCVTKLSFITVGLHGISIVIVYAKQNFGIAERVIISMWCCVSTIITVAIYLYYFITSIRNEPGYGGVKITDTWDLGCWVFASAPFLAIPAAAIHSFQTEEGAISKKFRFLFCGHRQDRFDPPQDYGYYRPEPSAPPYGNSETHTYAYMDDSYPMDEVPYNKNYHDPESEPLHHGSRI